MAYERLYGHGKLKRLLEAGKDPALCHSGGPNRLLRVHRTHVEAAAADPSFPPVGPLLMRRIADARTMKLAMDQLCQNGRKAAGPDKIQILDLTHSEQWALAQRLARSVLRCCLCPGRGRLATFAKPGKPGQFRTVTVQDACDRVVGKAATLILEPIVERVFSPFSFGFRPHRGTVDALATALALIDRQGGRVCVSADVKQAFDRVPFERMLDACRRHFPEDVVQFLRLISDTGKKQGTPQGSPHSPLMWNVFADHFFARPHHRSRPDRPLLCYADDLMVICQSEQEAREVYEELAKIARSAGTPLKETVEEAVCDLTKQPVQWLGYRLRLEEGRVTVRIGEKAWEDLETKFAQCHLDAASPLRAIQVVEGWLGYRGPCYEDEDRQHVLSRLRRLARQHAFDELPSDDCLEASWEARANRWDLTKACARARLDQELAQLTAMTRQ